MKNLVNRENTIRVFFVLQFLIAFFAYWSRLPKNMIILGETIPLVLIGIYAALTLAIVVSNRSILHVFAAPFGIYLYLSRAWAFADLNYQAMNLSFATSLFIQLAMTVALVVMHREAIEHKSKMEVLT